MVVLVKEEKEEERARGFLGRFFSSLRSCWADEKLSLCWAFARFWLRF